MLTTSLLHMVSTCLPEVPASLRHLRCGIRPTPGPASRSSLPPSQHFPQELLWALRSKRETNKSPCPQSHLTVPGSRPMDWGSEALPERRGVELCISILRTPVRLAVQHPGWNVLRSPGQASVQRQLELVRPPGGATAMGLQGPGGGPTWKPRWCPRSLWAPGPPWPSEAMRAGECACLGDLGRVLGRGGELGL